MTIAPIVSLLNRESILSFTCQESLTYVPSPLQPRRRTSLLHHSAQVLNVEEPSRNTDFQVVKMRLINTTTIELHEFHGRNIPDYAILSHVWGEDEVSFQDLQSRNKLPYHAIISRNGIEEDVSINEIPNQIQYEGQGWQKIKRCCELATRKGYEYVWIDTCCIDKTSSAELTEAINSMFNWYRDASICYAYLADVPGAEKLEDHWNDDSPFRRSRWFKRCWTLQELLAPRDLVFFSKNWERIDHKINLHRTITEVTGIKDWGDSSWHFDSVATKMSWAADRECTRVEDVAYSLLGLFNVNMPLLYGEGSRAFRRLQLEILKESSDDSIFSWEHDLNSLSESGRLLLAPSPGRFRRSGAVKKYSLDPERPPYMMTNMGLQIETILIQSPSSVGRYYLPLNCSSQINPREPFLIRLIRLAGHTNRFVTSPLSRNQADELSEINKQVSDLKKDKAERQRRLIYIEDH